MFKVIKKNKTCIKAKHKAFTNFALSKSNNKPKSGAFKEKKNILNSRNMRNIAINI